MFQDDSITPELINQHSRDDSIEGLQDDMLHGLDDDSITPDVSD